jgi:uncharacterized protein
MKKAKLTLRQRLLAVALYILSILVLSRLITKSWIPMAGGKDLWFFSAIGYYFFSHLSSPFFVTPRDSLANSLSSALLLATTDLASVPQFGHELSAFRWTSFLVAALVAISAVAAIGLYGANPVEHPRRAALSHLAFRVSDLMGRGSIMFSPLVLISIVGFYQGEPVQQMWLIFAWGVLVFVEPVELAIEIIGEIGELRKPPSETRYVGEIDRIDDPNLVRVRLVTAETWNRETVHVVHLPDSRQVEVLPLFVQLQGLELIGTGLCDSSPSRKVENTSAGHVYHVRDLRSASEFLTELCGNGSTSELIGFVIENSDIATICFEVSSEQNLEEGWLVFVQQRGLPVYYQILNARTKEESFSDNPRGTQIVFAEQLGTLCPKKGFTKYGWLPSMNSPVFLPASLDEEAPPDSGQSDDFGLGHVPHSKVPVTASFGGMLEYHTAILGVTGTGKTELAFDIIRHALTQGTKVFCVDFTGEYGPRLADVNPMSLGLAVSQERELQQRLFDVETGKFAAADEKKALREFIDEIAPEVVSRVDSFLQQDEPLLGIFELAEIANTKATLRATELYLSAIFNWARKNRRRRRILLVLEEAHTVVPENNFFSHDRVETDAVVGRMTQIALQGRKYGVGILLISQRTALVSKTLLSQCNTVLSFALHDQTGLNYLASVFSTDYVNVIPNLSFLQGVAFGKAINCDRPIIFEVPFRDDKKKASEALDNPSTEIADEEPLPDLGALCEPLADEEDEIPF